MENDKKVIARVSAKGQEVLIVKKARLQGYMFYAVGDESLPFATDLAILQTQKGIRYIEARFRIE